LPCRYHGYGYSVGLPTRANTVNRCGLPAGFATHSHTHHAWLVVSGLTASHTSMVSKFISPSMLCRAVLTPTLLSPHHQALAISPHCLKTHHSSQALHPPSPPCAVEPALTCNPSQPLPHHRAQVPQPTWPLLAVILTHLSAVASPLLHPNPSPHLCHIGPVPQGPARAQTSQGAPSLKKELPRCLATPTPTPTPMPSLMDALPSRVPHLSRLDL